MSKMLVFSVLLFLASGAMAQVVAKVDKKTKEFTIEPDQKTSFSIIGYQYPNTTTKTLICFSSSEDVVRANSSKCPLGSYFDTHKMNVNDKIVYLGPVGAFAKMSYISGNGTKTLFYITKSFFVIK